MWLPTNSSFRCLRAVKNLALCLVLITLYTGCAGYQLGADIPSVLGDGTKTLKVKGVDYPTLQPWLPYALRSSLRDEVNARMLARWVDSGSADYEIQINVLSYTSREWMSSEIDTTVLFDSRMALEAIIYEGSTNNVVWRSGTINYTERLEEVDEKQGAGDLIKQIMRQLTDKMRNTF